MEWIDGADAYEVAIAAVGGNCGGLAGSDGSVELALATGENWPDALAASALDRPLLLSQTAALHLSVRRFVQSCPSTVDIVILGGTAAISQQVESELVALGASVRRIAGADRYETASKIAEFAAPSQVSQVYLATGSNFADAIAAAPRVTASTPIVLTPNAQLGADASAFLSARLSGQGQVVILGGTAAVSRAVQDDLRALQLSPRRIAGRDRYDTAALIARESLTDPSCGSVDDIAVASGTDPYGGLTAASVRNPCQPLLLVPPTGAKVPKAISDFAENWADILASQTGLTGTITAVGPRSTISSQAVQQLAGVEPQGESSSAQDDPQEAVGEQFLNDYVTVSASEGSRSALAWWRRPRGDLSVNVHVCVEQGLEHQFAQTDLAAYAAHYNRVIAPFYSWQSSGLLNVGFQPGQIIVSSVLASAQSYDDWGSVIAPFDCLDRFRPIEPHVGHVFFVYSAFDYAHQRHSNPLVQCTAHRGCGQLGGPFSRVPLLHDPNDPSLVRTPLGHGATRVVEHEFDHNIGAPHFYDVERGHIRLTIPVRELDLPTSTDPWSSLIGGAPPVLRPDDEKILGSLDGYPEGVGTAVHGSHPDDYTFGPRNSYPVYPCYVPLNQGWPVGAGHPACIRVPPHPGPQVSLTVDADGSANIEWQPSQKGGFNHEPVTGFAVVLERVEQTGLRTVVEHVVSAKTTSHSFAAGTVDMTDYGAEYTALVRPTSAIGLGGGGRASFQVLPPTGQITATQRPAFDSVEAPIVFDLSWTPAPNATSYRICGFRICEDSRNALPVNGTTYILSEQLNHVAEGESYDITVWACGTAYETVWVQRLGEPPGCFRYATTTITAESMTATTTPALEIAPTPLGTCSWQHPTTGAIHPCSRVTWALDSRADWYYVRFGCGADGTALCPAGWRGTGELEFADGRRVGFDGPDWPEGGWADVSLTPGIRHRVRVFACPRPFDQSTCFEGGDAWLVGESWVTIPDSGS